MESQKLIFLKLQNTLIGNGIYLSQELSVTLPYSHCGFGWGASCLGGHLSCVAMCEVVDAPEGINYQKPPMCEGIFINIIKKYFSIQQALLFQSNFMFIIDQLYLPTYYYCNVQFEIPGNIENYI